MQLLEKTKENEQMVRDRNTFLEQKVEERTHAFRKAMQKSDDLLLNILPEPIANELKEYGKTKAKTYGLVTVRNEKFIYSPYHCASFLLVRQPTTAGSDFIRRV